MFTNRERVAMLDLVAKLSTSIGACERLVQTPVPLSYARHTSRFLSLWCLTLPFVLVPKSGFIAAPVMALATWALFGIQEIGNWIEEPFRGSLKLGVLCDTVFKDVRETAKYFSALNKRKDPSAAYKLSIVSPLGPASSAWGSCCCPNLQLALRTSLLLHSKYATYREQSFDLAINLRAPELHHFLHASSLPMPSYERQIQSSSI